MPADDETTITAAGAALGARIAVPDGARGLVVFVHGAGSDRNSPRNRYVAARLGAAGVGTVLVDVLTEAEAAEDRRTGGYRFDIDLLARRTVGIVDAIRRRPDTADTPVGVYGASTGAAGALVAAAQRPEIQAVVSRGGRADLAGEALTRARAPTLLVVGEADPTVVELNRTAQSRMVAESRLEIVPGAGHLFSEAGALEHVADVTARWFVHHLATAAAD